MRKNHCSSWRSSTGGAAALAVAVDDLLVGQHGGVLGTPVDRGLLAVGQPALEQLQEDPLRPAVVARLVGAELARPVDRDAPGAELALEGGDRRLGGRARVLAGLDRVVLGGQAERVVAHRVQHAHAVAAAEVRDRVTDRVVLQVPHVGLAGRVREHLEHVGARGPVVDVRNFPGALALPDRLPFAFDLVRLVTMLGHWARRLAPAATARGARLRGELAFAHADADAEGFDRRGVIAAEAVKRRERSAPLPKAALRPRLRDQRALLRCSASREARATSSSCHATSRHTPRGYVRTKYAPPR